MSALILTHLLALGAWIGCIATETVFEHTTGKQPGMAARIAALHVKVDLWVEVPAFLVVLASGAALFLQVPLSALLVVKSTIGLLAVLSNMWCVWIVVARNTALIAGDETRALRLDHWQHKTGGLLVVLIALTLALAVFV